MRLYIPKSFPDNLAYVFTILMVIYMSVFQAFFMLPRYYDISDFMFWLHLTCGIFILYNVVGNLYKLVKIDSSIRGIHLASHSTPAWRFCSVCESVCPPRSYHCSVCGICILKRDHHCTFTGSCIGLTNHRYYLLVILYFALAAIYAAFFNVSFMVEMMGGTGLRSFLRMVLPVLCFTIGEISLYQTLMAMTNVACFGGGALLICLTYFHWVLLASRNLTVFERIKRINDYDVGVQQNLSQIFGKRWLKAVLCPWASSPLPVDGLAFPMRDGRTETFKSQ